MEIEQYIETLLYGNKVDAKKAKDALKKEIDRTLHSSWKSKKQREKDRKIFSKEILCMYRSIFSSYKSIKNHNKASILSLVSYSSFYLEDSEEYFESFLDYIREALQDANDGNLRHIAVLTCSNIYSAYAWRRTSISGERVSAKQKTISEKYTKIILQHVTKIFDVLETCIEKDENNFPDAVDAMKPSVVKSHLLYILNFDRFDVLADLSGMYEDTYMFSDNENYKQWREFYEGILKSHPRIEKFIKKVPSFELTEYDEYEHEDDDAVEMINTILNSPVETNILSSDFFFGGNKKDQEAMFKGFSIPKDSYFEIWDLVQDVDDQDVLFEIFNVLYLHAWQAPVSDIYWYDLVDFTLSKYHDVPLRLKILEEALKKLSVKIDVCAPLDTDDKNNIYYGIHEHRPIFRILIAYALYQHEFGDKKIAIEYYRFLLGLNPNDNQGVRYLFAALYADKPASYTDELFDEGNKNQNWTKIENFLNEQNEKRHFWNEPKQD